MRLKLIIAGLLFSFVSWSQTDNVRDREIYKSYIETVVRRPGVNFDQSLMVKTGYFLLGTPYVSYTLEKEPESLVVNLRELDCMTFVESVLAMSTSSREGSYEKFCEILQRNRYREAVIHDYVDRLHYTSDWVYNNEQRGIVRDVTKELGGKKIDWHINFMSTHPDSYRPLKGNTERIEKIREVEKQINSRTYYYLPKEEFTKTSSGIKDGDIIGFVTSVKGLDISHVGIACHVDGKLTFMHASSVGKKQVIINELSLQEYMNASRSNLGLIVVRPVFRK